MKTVIIGDVHGHDTWLKIVEKEGSDAKYVFVGDYFDAFSVPFNTQMTNFKNILQYSKSHDFTLLAGNHDNLSYVTENMFQGYQELYAPQIREVLLQANLVAAHAVDDVLITHAGVTQEWVKNMNILYNTAEDLAHTINTEWEDNPHEFMMKKAPYLDFYGNYYANSPMWVRPRGMMNKRGMVNMTQVVGHTVQDRVTRKINPYNQAELWLVDCWNEYLVIDDYFIIKDLICEV